MNTSMLPLETQEVRIINLQCLLEHSGQPGVPGCGGSGLPTLPGSPRGRAAAPQPGLPPPGGDGPGGGVSPPACPSERVLCSCERTFLAYAKKRGRVLHG